MKQKRIYLDTASGTLVDSGLPGQGNPSSIHAEGVAAEKALEAARVSVASNFKCQPDEIVFTSGGTESNNLALFGVVEAWRQSVQHRVLHKTKHSVSSTLGHIIVSAIEHASVLQSAKELEKRGVALTILPVDKAGVVDLKVLKESLRPETILVSIMFANNEVGTIEPIKDIAKILRDYRRDQGLDRDHANYPYFHTDACQATRFFDLDTRKLGADLVTINANKMYGPKGSGVLYARRGVKIKPLFFGGGQENGLRSGTENVAGAVGLAKAFALATKLHDKETKNLIKLRDYVIKKIQKEIPAAILNGPLLDSRVNYPTNRLPNNINFTFPGVDAEWLVLQLDAKGISCSTGSACSFNTLAGQAKDESYVIIALGKSESDAKSSVRFSLGRDTTKQDLNYLIKLLKQYAHPA